MSDPVEVHRHPGGVVLVTLSRPARRNVMDAEMTAAWVETMAQLRGDAQLRAVVITGAGPAFCAGGDLTWLGSGQDQPIDQVRARMRHFYEDWLSVRTLEVPTIAALNGAAVGAGLCLALACDLRYATPSAALSVPFTMLGLHPGMAASWLLPEITSAAIARDLLYTGRAVRGEEAVRLGLVSALADDVCAHALDVAATIAAAAPVAIRLTKQALARGSGDGIDAALRWEGLAQAVTMTTADLQEGLAAQRERRTPQFDGR